MGFSDTIADALLNHLFGKSVLVAPTIYVGLSTADPNADGSGVAEPAAASYARLQTAAATWAAAAGGNRTVTNAAKLTFTKALEAWGTVTHAALFDAATNGTFLGYAPLGASKEIAANDTFEVEIGDGQFVLADAD